MARVSNITETLKELKKRGLWIYGLDMDGESWCSVDLTGAAALVVGSEGRGISPSGERAVRFSVVPADAGAHFVPECFRGLWNRIV